MSAAFWRSWLVNRRGLTWCLVRKTIATQNFLVHNFKVSSSLLYCIEYFTLLHFPLTTVTNETRPIFVQQWKYICTAKCRQRQQVGDGVKFKTLRALQVKTLKKAVDNFCVLKPRYHFMIWAEWKMIPHFHGISNFLTQIYGVRATTPRSRMMMMFEAEKKYQMCFANFHVVVLIISHPEMIILS